MNPISAQEVAELLGRQAQLLEQAAQQIRVYAQRAATGDAGSVSNGQGHHFLVSQSLREVLAANSNMPIAQAFQAAAEADQAS